MRNKYADGNVKNTMRVPLIDLLIPHYCCSCGAIGAILCEYCKYDITNEPFAQCVVCLGPTRPRMQLCGRCRPGYTKVWCVSERSGALKELINQYKFHRVRSAGDVLASLADAILPDIPKDVIVVPIPTIARHRRTRGYGHTERIAHEVAKTRALPYREVLSRRTSHVQHGSSKRQRELQASTAFETTAIDGGRFLLVDDVYTTGATVKYAAKTLTDAGASEVWVLVISRQPLEK